MASSMEKLVVASYDAGVAAAAKASGGSEVETVRFECCDVGEECTAAYVVGVCAAFCGDWLCGLCGEAVKERVAREPSGGVEAALVSHEVECRDFNATTRLNPTLSLAGSMRGIAGKRFDRRNTTPASASARTATSAPPPPRFQIEYGSTPGRSSTERTGASRDRGGGR